MKIIIWDSTNSRCIANQKAITEVANASSVTVNVQVWTDSLAPQNGTLSPECDLLLLHATDETEAMKWFQGKCVSVPRVLKYGGREIAGGVPRAVSDHDPLKDFEVKGILESVRDSSNQETFIERALAIWSAVPENLLSWALIEKYGKGANNGADITADATLVNAATSELRQRSGDANAALTLENVEKVIAEYRADF